MAAKVKNSEYFVSPASTMQWKVFSQYWWVILFIVGVYCAYSHSMNTKQKELQALREVVAEINVKKQGEQELNAELLAHRASHNDPEYIKLLLMKNLGLVSEGQVKVSFQ